MSSEQARRRLALRIGLMAVRASLLVSSRPAALILRRLFAHGGAEIARGLARHAPGGVEVRRDERYAAGGNALLDLYRPEGSKEALPVVVWIHGGGWLGGSKEDLTGFFRLIAARDYAVAAPRYALAPEHHYPDRRLGHYAPERLRGAVLACGAYDLALLTRGSSLERSIATAILWAYSGHRAFQRDASFALASVADHLSAAFPPALVTVGNADPLRAHSLVLAQRLRACGVDVDALFFPDHRRPPLGHEYQFDLDSDAGRQFLERLTSFLARRLAG